MFWKREKKTAVGSLGMLEIPPMLPKKQFSIMLEMLRDSEKYDNDGETEVSIAMLTNLCEFIERYKAGSRSTITVGAMSSSGLKNDKLSN